MKDTSENLGSTSIPNSSCDEVERIYRKWDEAWSNDDLDAMIDLYAPDAVLESPLIPYLMKTNRGICRGREEIRSLLHKAAPRKPRKRTFFRPGYFTNGHLLIWEYPRATPDGEQMDFVEVMEIEKGLIKKHRVYWGWAGVEVIKSDSYYK